MKVATAMKVADYSINTMKKAGVIFENCNSEKSNDEPASDKQTRLIPLTDWPKYHPWPPVGGLRHLMFYRETNGFATAFKKCRRRVLVDEREFFKCIVAQRGENHGSAAA